MNMKLQFAIVINKYSNISLLLLSNSICESKLVLTILLPELVNDFDVHGGGEAGDDGGLVGSCELVGPLDGLLGPVGPVEVVLEDGDAEGVLDAFCSAHDDPLVAAHKVHSADTALLGIDPVHQAQVVVDGESVGPGDTGISDGHSLLTVHAGALDLAVLSPVAPEHEAGFGVDSDCSGLVEVVADQDCALGTVEGADGDLVQPSVGPVEELVGPVDGDAIGSLDGIRNLHGWNGVLKLKLRSAKTNIEIILIMHIHLSFHMGIHPIICNYLTSIKVCT